MVNALYITALFNASVKTKDDGMFGQGCLLEGLQSRELYILHTSRAKIRWPHDHCFFYVSSPWLSHFRRTGIHDLQRTWDPHCSQSNFLRLNSSQVISPSVHLPSAFTRRPFSQQCISPRRCQHSTRTIAWPPWKNHREHLNPIVKDDANLLDTKCTWWRKHINLLDTKKM